MFDYKIVNGHILDGTGQPAFEADLGLKDGRIAALKPHLEGEAEQAIDAAGRMVSPGFIDMHTHSDFTLLLQPQAPSRIMQGVTTEVVGNCGGSPAPILDRNYDSFMQYTQGLGRFYHRALPAEDWCRPRLDDFYSAMYGRGVSVNTAPLVGHSTLRCAVMGYEKGPPNAAQLAEMKDLLAGELAAGAFGLSTGMIYHPGAFAAMEELVELARVVRAHGGIYSTHIRSEGRFLFEAVREALAVAGESGVSLQISHLKCETPARWGLAGRILEMIDQARAKGLDVTFDQYPYPAYYTSLLEIFPTWAKENGTARMMEVLADPAQRERVKNDMTNPPEDWDDPLCGLDWDKVLILGMTTPDLAEHDGLSVARLSEKLGLDPLETVFEVYLREKGTLGMIVFSMNEDDLEEIMRHPAGMVGSDGCSVGPDGVTGQIFVHPRYYGTFPRVLGRYVRQRSVLPLEEAVRKMTGFTAQKLGLTDRGLLKTGYMADVVVFDPETIIDRAEFQAPHQYAQGVEHVWVNGRLTATRGSHTGELAGQALKHHG